MAGQRSLNKFLEFLDYVKDKGLIKGSTAAGRRSAAEKVFVPILGEQEREDVTSVDLDDVMNRFNNLEGKNYTPGSLYTYQSRLKSALDDFELYVSNPLGFRSGTQSRERRVKTKDDERPSQESKTVGQPDTGVSRHSAGALSSSIMPIQLRQDLVIHIQGLPFDLTSAEAKKLANVILALASD